MSRFVSLRLANPDDAVLQPLAPKRLLVGVGDAGLVAFTGGDSSRVVETFGLEQIFSWSVRSARDITLLLAADTGEDVRRLTLRCEQSEQLGSLLARVSRRAERSARRGSSDDAGDVLGRESSMSRSLQTVSRRNLDTAARPNPPFGPLGDPPQPWRHNAMLEVFLPSHTVPTKPQHNDI